MMLNPPLFRCKYPAVVKIAAVMDVTNATLSIGAGRLEGSFVVIAVSDKVPAAKNNSW